MNINTNMMTAYFPKAGYKMGIEKKKLSGTKDTDRNIEGYLHYKPFWDFLTKKEEPMQSVEQQVQRNQSKKLSLEEMKKCSGSMDNGVSDDEEQVTISTEEGLQTWYEGRTLAEWALTDPQYTDSETGFSWYVRDGKHPYMVGKDAEKFKEMCQETGESWLKKFAEMTGMIQYLDDNTVAYVGTNGIAVKSKDGKELSVDTSSLTYDMIQSLLQNMRGAGNYFDSQHWQEAIEKIKYNAVS